MLDEAERRSTLNHAPADRPRCGWATTPLLRDYHDAEWGVPDRDPRSLWETLSLEGFQAGLSWEVVLRKRDAFRRAFAGFDPSKVAAFDEQDVERLVVDAEIIRSRAKIVATIEGARAFEAMRTHGEDFSAFCWAFVGGRVVQGTASESETATSALMSKELRRRGFKFVGPTIVHAWMQAVGLINDHEPSCFRRPEVALLDRPLT